MVNGRERTQAGGVGQPISKENLQLNMRSQGAMLPKVILNRFEMVLYLSAVSPG